MRKNMILIAGVVILVTGYIAAQQLTTSERLTPSEAQKLMQNDSTIVILDVRTPAEFIGELGHIKGALLIPVQELEKRVGELERYKTQRIVAVCRSGHRSVQAVSILKANGFNAIDIAGGMTRWNAEKLPVEKPAQ